MALKLDKEALFNNYIDTALEVLADFEVVFGIDNVASQFFGQIIAHGETQIPDRQAAMKHVQQSDAWRSLSRLYDYAVDGVLDDPNPDEIVESAADVLTYFETYSISPADDWIHIVQQGDGRFALDDGQDIIIDKLRLLAGVDIRTVRNAVSAGDLAAHKVDGDTFINNDTAREWLSLRRSFKPTRIISTDKIKLSQVSSPVEFAAFLKAQRETLGFDLKDKKLAFIHPSLDARIITDVEGGIFKLPLDSVFPLADFYQIEKQPFLNMVMRVFYKDQLSMIQINA